MCEAMRLIVTDLDKTLLTDDKVISEYSTGVLLRCRALGYKIAFATARPSRAASGFQSEFKPDYTISNNGATISCADGTVIYNNCISSDTRDKLLATLLAAKEVTCLTVEAGDYLLTDYSGIPWDSANWNQVYCDFSEGITCDTPKISIECQDSALIRGIISEYPSLHVYFNSDENWSQVMHSDSTKMNAIRRLTGLLNISVDDVIAFGDDSNDIEMLRLCGKGVAVENAIEAARLAAGFICSDNNHDGVAKWIENELIRQ